jgi:dihydropteroate synthase
MLWRRRAGAIRDEAVLSMLREIYVRPAGLMAAIAAKPAAEVRGGFRLAGGWLDFTALDIFERNGGSVDRRLAGLGEFFEKDWGRRTANAADMFENIMSPRARLTGLSFDRPRIMGIVNVTPDSFSDGGAHVSVDLAIAHALKLAADGADILDIGGESTRPGAVPVPLAVELARVIPVIEGLAGKTDARISVDTRKAEVMARAAKAGADIINDVSALMHDPGALGVVADSGLPVVLMHAQGDPRTMQDAPVYDHVVLDVFDFLEARVDACRRAGIPLNRIVVDPGIGFGKTLEHNIELMAGLSLFHGLGCPVLMGASRKRFIGTIAKVETAGDRVHGSVAAALAAIAQGAQIVRVHDVRATREALDVWMASVTGKVGG